MNCSKSLRDIAALSSLTGCLHHSRSWTRVTFREALLRILKDLSLPWGGQRWEIPVSWWTGSVFSPSGTFCAGLTSVLTSVLTSAALHRAGRAAQDTNEEHTELWVSLSTGAGQEGCGHLIYLQLLGELLISCTAFRLCLSQAQSLIWGGNEHKASSRCPIHSTTIPEEPGSSVRCSSVPSKGPSPWADSQTPEQMPLEHPEPVPRQLPVLLDMLSHRYFCRHGYNSQELFADGRCFTSGCSHPLVLIAALLLQTISSKLTWLLNTSPPGLHKVHTKKVQSNWRHNFLGQSVKHKPWSDLVIKNPVAISATEHSIHCPKSNHYTLPSAHLASF